MQDEMKSKIIDLELELGCMISCYGMIIAAMFSDDGMRISDTFPPGKMNEALTSFLWQMEHLLDSIEGLEKFEFAIPKDIPEV